MQELQTADVGVATIDVLIMGAYLVLILTVGTVVSRMASKNLDSYFLGGRKLPWWLLGLSGTACYFDVAGVMWTISLFYTMGQQFIWPQFMWGSVAMLACFAAFMGKWLRRSQVLTGAEWMVIRFGSGPAGEFARAAYAVMAVVIAVAFIGFAEYGCGRFLLTFTPPPAQEYLAQFVSEENVPHVLAITLMAFTAIYAIAAGLVGVGITGFIQFLLVLLGSSILIVKAVGISTYDAIASQVPPEWFSIVPPWHWPRLGEWSDTAGWVLFGPVLLTWLAKGVALGAGGPQQLYDLQRFLAARSPREASLAGMIWGVGLVPMFMVSAAVGVIGIVTWGGNLSNPDQLYPVVIGTMLPIGIKGLVLAGLLSAFMSTFSATVNAGASYLTFDLYKKFVRPNANDQHLVRASRIASSIIVIAGIVVGVQATNINQIFEWIMMVLGTGILMPNVLRWFWWRFNGVGFAVGTLAGTFAAVGTVISLPDAPTYVTFPVLLAISLVTSVAATLLSRPVDQDVIEGFYGRVRPFGYWGPVKRLVAKPGEEFARESAAADILTALVTAIGLQALFLVATYACTHQTGACSIASAVVALSGLCVYFSWYRKLPAE